MTEGGREGGRAGGREGVRKERRKGGKGTDGGRGRNSTVPSEGGQRGERSKR